MQSSSIKLNSGPTLRQTPLGWIIAGRATQTCSALTQQAVTWIPPASRDKHQIFAAPQDVNILKGKSTCNHHHREADIFGYGMPLQKMSLSSKNMFLSLINSLYRSSSRKRHFPAFFSETPNDQVACTHKNKNVKLKSRRPEVNLQTFS